MRRTAAAGAWRQWMGARGRQRSTGVPLLPYSCGCSWCRHCATGALHLLRSSAAQLPAMCLPLCSCRPEEATPKLFAKARGNCSGPAALAARGAEANHLVCQCCAAWLHSGLAESQLWPCWLCAAPPDPLLWPHAPPPAADAHRMFSPWEPVLTAPNRTLACQRLRSFVSRPYEHPLLPTCSLAAGRFVGEAAPAVLRLFAGTCAAAEASPPGAMTEGEAAIDSKLYLLRGRACTLVRQHGAGS